MRRSTQEPTTSPTLWVLVIAVQALVARLMPNELDLGAQASPAGAGDQVFVHLGVGAQVQRVGPVAIAEADLGPQADNDPVKNIEKG